MNEMKRIFQNRTPGIKLDLSKDLGLSKVDAINGDNEVDDDCHDDDDGGSKRILTQFDIEGHPVYGRISVTNGEINRMSLQQMKQRCRQLRLDNLGKREAVKRRLKVMQNEIPIRYNVLKSNAFSPFRSTTSGST